MDDLSVITEKVNARVNTERALYGAKSIDGQKAKISPDGKVIVLNPIERDLLFPEKVCTGIAGEFAGLYSSYLEPCFQFFFMSFLTCLGNILSGHITLDSELKQQPRLFTLLLGESADDRKSTAIQKVVQFFQESVDSFKMCWTVGSAEGLQTLFELNERIVLLHDEFKSFVSKSRIDGSVLLPAVTTLFESNSFESHTKHKTVTLQNAHLSFLAASTIDTYQQTWTSAFTDIGFGNRLFLVPGTAKRKYSIPQTIPERLVVALKNKLGDVIAAAMDSPRIPVECEAHRLFHEWYMNRDNSVHQKRLDTYGHRLMILISANDGKKIIDVETMQKVISLLEWQLEVRRIHDPIDAENSIAKMEEKIRRQLSKNDKKPRELKQATHANRDGIWIYQTALKNLQEEREVKWDNQAGMFHLSSSSV